MAKKLGNLPEKEVKAIVDYAKTHSLRETAEWIKDKYGVEVSHSSVRRYLNINWRALTDREYRVSQEVITSIEEVIQGYRALLASLGNNRAAKIKVLKNFGSFLVELYDKFGNGKPTVTETHEINTKKELDWQKEIK